MPLAPVDPPVVADVTELDLRRGRGRSHAAHPLTAADLLLPGLPDARC